MFCSSKTNSSMATLLQQKNCMTALTNGTVVSGSGSTSNATNNSGTDEKSTILTGHHHHNHHHDIVTIPSSADIVVNSVISSGGSVSGGGVGYGGIISSNSVNDNFGSILSSATTTAGDNFSYFITQSLPATTTNSIIGHNTNNSQQHQQQHQQQHHQIQNSLTFQNFDIISNNHHQSNNHIQSYSNTTRYFSQFSNQETDFLYNMPTTSSSLSSDSNNRHISGPISSSSSFGLNANTNANANNGTLVSFTTAAASVTTAASHSTNYPAIKQEPPNTTSSSSSSLLLTASRNLNASNRIDGTKELSNNPIANSREQKIEIDDDQKPILTANTDGENVAQQQQHEHEQQQQNNAEQEQESEPEIDIVINNVVCSFSVRCHLNLREIALNGFNVEFRRENGMVTMKLRRPYTTASIWSSGRITCTGATSEEQAKIAARRYARCLQKLGFSVRFHNFRVVNVLGTCSMPWAIKIVNFSEKYKKDASYEPELHPGVTYKLKYPKATLKIFSTGSITVTAGSVAYVQAAIEHIFPLVYEFRKKRTPEEMELLRAKHNPVIEDAVVVNDDEILHTIPTKKRKRPPGCADNDPNEDIMYVSDYEMDEQDPDDPE